MLRTFLGLKLKKLRTYEGFSFDAGIPFWPVFDPVIRACFLNM